MKGSLNNTHIEYLFFHLNYIFNLHDEIKQRIIFISDFSDIEKYYDRIIFYLSSQDIDMKRIKRVDNIPLLFPSSDRNEIFYFKNNNLIFSDDILNQHFICFQVIRNMVPEKMMIWEDFHIKHLFKKN